MQAKVIAHSNIALAKYWGKLDSERNLTAVPSLSLTLDALRTTTHVQFDESLASDELVLDGRPSAGRPRERVTRLLDRVRELAGMQTRARVTTANDFPTAAGLASSASGFAALALAATRAAGLPLDLGGVSALARASSASAARSLFGGFAALRAGAEQAERVAPGEHFPLVMLVALTATGPKDVGSTDGMQHTSRTSPYYPAWVEHAPRLFEQAHGAVLERDLPRLGEAMEQSTLMMHASMLAAAPGLLYWVPASLRVIHEVRALRARGTAAYFTMDAGPHVKVLTAPADAERVERALLDCDGVERVVRCQAGPDAREVQG